MFVRSTRQVIAPHSAARRDSGEVRGRIDGEERAGKGTPGGKAKRRRNNDGRREEGGPTPRCVSLNTLRRSLLPPSRAHARARTHTRVQLQLNRPSVAPRLSERGLHAGGGGEWRHAGGKGTNSCGDKTEGFQLAPSLVT